MVENLRDRLKVIQRAQGERLDKRDRDAVARHFRRELQLHHDVARRRMHDRPDVPRLRVEVHRESPQLDAVRVIRVVVQTQPPQQQVARAARQRDVGPPRMTADPEDVG